VRNAAGSLLELKCIENRVQLCAIRGVIDTGAKQYYQPAPWCDTPLIREHPSECTPSSPPRRLHTPALQSKLLLLATEHGAESFPSDSSPVCAHHVVASSSDTVSLATCHALIGNSAGNQSELCAPKVLLDFIRKAAGTLVLCRCGAQYRAGKCATLWQQCCQAALKSRSCRVAGLQCSPTPAVGPSSLAAHTIVFATCNLMKCVRLYDAHMQCCCASAAGARTGFQVSTRLLH